MDALTGPVLGSRIFKIPNLLYFNTVNHLGGKDTIIANDISGV